MISQEGAPLSIRHAIAVGCITNNDLYVLADALKEAAQDAIAHEISPYMDPACRLICHQIAFAGNGDLPFKKYYQDAFAFCSSQVELDQQNLPEKKDVKVPPYSPS